MEKRAEILNELKALGSPLAGLPVAMPFQLPARYFQALAGDLSDGIAAAESLTDPILSLPKRLPFVVPVGYFEALPAAMLHIASVDQEKEISIPRTGDAFSVPAGYFDSLADRLLRAAKESDVVAAVKPKTRVIALPSLRPVLRWAAAAILILGIGFGGYRFLNQKNSIDTAGQLAKVEKTEIYQYVQQNIDDFDEEALTLASVNGAGAITNVELDLEDQEIIDYLDQNGWEAEDIETEL